MMLFSLLDVQKVLKSRMFDELMKPSGERMKRLSPVAHKDLTLDKHLCNSICTNRNSFSFH